MKQRLLLSLLMLFVSVGLVKAADNPIKIVIPNGEKVTVTFGGSFSATLVWNLTNMLPFSANQQKAKDTKDNIRKMELSLETLKENTALNIRTQIDNLNQAWANIEAASGNITLAQKSYDMNVTSYQNGTRELLDVKDAESQLNQAKLGLINSKYEYLTGLLDLEYSLNIDLIN